VSRKTKSEVGAIVEGPGPEGTGGVYICRGCAEFALDIFEQMEEERRGGESHAGKPK
jgi:hypothetical protein